MTSYVSAASILGLPKQDATGPIAFLSRVAEGLPLASLDRCSRLIAPGDVQFNFRIVPKATLARKRVQRARLSAEQSDVLVRLVRVWLKSLEVWGSDAEARDFLNRPHPLLEQRKPIDVVLAGELGGDLVTDILGRLQYGSAA